jgi:hypothetical protein
MSTSEVTRSMRPEIRTRVATNTDDKKCTPHITAKKLPWLDGRHLQNVSTTPTKRRESVSSSPSSSTRPSSRPPSVAKTTKRAMVTVPVGQSKRPIVPTTSHVSSVASSSPSPVTRHRISQARRAPSKPKDPAPLKDQTPHRSHLLHGQQKRSVIIQRNKAPEQDGSGDIRPWTENPVPVARHPESSDASDSMFQTDVNSSTSPEAVSRVQITPLQPVPSRRGLERVGNRRISNGIEGLEDMVQEAIELADETADRGQVKEIYEIIEDAKAALQNASVDPTKHLMATMSPLVVSESSKEFENFRLAIPEAHDNVHRGSASFDWAYPQQHRQSSSRSSSLSSSDIEQKPHANFSTQSDLLLPPQPIQTASRDHVDFVLRPIAREESRGRSRRRLNGDSAVPIRKHRHRRHSRHGPKSTSRRRQHMSSSLSPSDSSYNEEEEETRVNPYGNTLTVREQAHHHTFNLHRQHRRQPIARNWSKSKKRLAAIIACINTSLLGIIVGIYVS